MMRVGLSTTMIEPVLCHGHMDGIGVYTDALRSGLPAVGWSVQGYSYPMLGKPELTAQYSVGQPLARPFAVQTLRELALPAARHPALPVDVFHATDYRIVRMGCPVVATLHDAIPIKHPEWSSPRLRGLKNWLQKRAAQKADRVIALSEFAVAELVECFGIPEKRITVVPCGVGAAWLQKPEPAAVAATLAAHGLEPGYFLSVGTLQPRKNVERLLDAWLGLPESVRRERQLVIVGRPGWRCEELVRRLQAAQQQGERVVWLNRLGSQQDLLHVYAGAGVFVFPSLYEGFGIPVAEAFACGVPVVASNASSIPEVAQDAALLVDPLSVTDIGEAMLAMTRDEALRGRCIAAGRARAAALTWHRTAVETAAVYHGALGS